MCCLWSLIKGFTPVPQPKRGTGEADLGSGRGQRRPKRKHVSAWRMSWALEPTEASLVKSVRRGEGPAVRGEDVGLLEGGILRGILRAQQYPLSSALPIKLRA